MSDEELTTLDLLRGQIEDDEKIIEQKDAEIERLRAALQEIVDRRGTGVTRDSVKIATEALTSQASSNKCLTVGVDFAFGPDKTVYQCMKCGREMETSVIHPPHENTRVFWHKDGTADNCKPVATPNRGGK